MTRSMTMLFWSAWLAGTLAIVLPAARPTASLAVTCAPGARSCTFSGAGSDSSASGAIISYTYDWGDGRIESHTSPTATNTWPSGSYCVRLTVTDRLGLTSYATKQVTLPYIAGTKFGACSTKPVVVKPDTVKLPPDTVRLPAPPPDTIRLPAPPAIHDTVKVPCPCDTTKPPPIVVPPPPPPDTTTPTPTPSPAGETWAELPRVYLDTKLVPPTGKILSVPIGANLQAALNAAQGGDVIELGNGGTWSGNFTLPNKAGSQWITIRPAVMANVPAERTRMSPAQALAANLPKIVSPNNQGAINTDPSSHHWRLVALEVMPTVTNTGLIRLGSGLETQPQLPHDIVLDRMYVHGTATGENRRCVTLNGAAQAVIDSYIADCHQHGSDSQAISGWGGPGPFKITNNYLEAASENIMFGGSDPGIQGLIPSDIEIRHNHFTKQPSWLGQGWVVKNLFEIKNAQRVLFEGNVLENNWRDGQGGSAIVLKSVNQSGGCPWCVAKDITVRLNLIRNVGSGFALTGHDRGAQAIMTRVTITDNLVYGIDVAPQFSGDGRAFLINNDMIDLTIAHNTILGATNMAVTFGGPTQEPPTRLIVRDNIIGGGQYGVKGQGIGTAAALQAFMPNGGFTNNLLIQGASSGYPATTSFSSVAGVGFAVGYSLSPTSKFVGKATTGKNLGADVAAIMKAVAGVVIP